YMLFKGVCNLIEDDRDTTLRVLGVRFTVVRFGDDRDRVVGESSRNFYGKGKAGNTRPDNEHIRNGHVSAFGDLKHPLYGNKRLQSDVFGHRDFRLFVLEAEVKFFHSVEPHKGAFTTRAGVVLMTWRGNERLARNLLRHLMKDTGLGGDDIGAGAIVLHEVNHPGSGAHVVGYVKYMRLGFGVCDDLSLGMFLLQRQQLVDSKRLMDDAGSLPQQHVAAGLANQVSSEIFIRRKDDGLVLGNGANDLFRVGGGTDDIA